uniref:Prospero domain-containing protein n=1 Tax=Parastrongyloides trichosuri TaxID=131310 RepID=A0A0N5A242_PARTI
MSSGGAIPSSLLHTTNFPIPPLFPQGNFKIPGLNVSNLLPNNSSNHNSPSPQRIKTKRVRQRVDAGEPRNSYQNTNHTTFLQNKIRQPISNNMNNTTPVSNNSIFNNTNNNSLIGSNLSTSSELLELTLKNIAANNCSNSDIDRSNKVSDDLFEQDVENIKEENASDGEDKESEESNSLTSSSSSKRKSFTPKQLIEDEGEGEDSHESTNSPNLDHSGGDETVSESGNIDGIENNKPEVSSSLDASSTIGSDINQHIGDGLSKFQEYMEVQKRIYNGFLEQQKKVGLFDDAKKNGITNNINPNFVNTLPMGQNSNQISRDLQRLASALKQEILTSLTGSIDKVIADFTTSQEVASRLGTLNNFPFGNTQENNNLLGRSPLIMQSLYNNQFNNASGNNSNVNSSTGIFPNPLAGGSFNPFATSALIGNMSSLMGIRSNEEDLLPPRKKRSKVTDSVRISRYTSSQNSGSVPNSERNSPTLSFNFTPSLVNNSLYGNSSFMNLSNNNEEREESPMNSDELSDYGTNYDGPQNYQLTPMHLRKAKLMFFYTRYPSSALLKTYFPDIRFNKNNTAQLVKWFSNFREFFYSQMEKYARQAIAEGIKTREEVIVTPESEIYKQLNQHYNRNNHIQPPERLHLVIQETLREFFCAIQHGKDADPSWKKSIYKIINRLDETIPEYFKDPNFLERLE